MTVIRQRTNGEVCVLQCHSADNAELAGLTLMNHWQYAARHGYDFQICVEPWESSKWSMLEWTDWLLERYEYVFCIGSDVIITRPELPLSTFYDDDFGAVVAIEQGGSSPINNDTLLLNYRKGPEYLKYLWLHKDNDSHPWLHQQTTIELMREPDQTLVTAKRLQGLPVSGPGRWTADDFTLHFFCGDLQSKIDRVRRFLNTGEVTWMQ